MRDSKTPAINVLGAIACGLIVVGLLGYVTVGLLMQPKKDHLDSYEQWDKEVVAHFGSIPIQQGGRIMPLETFANFSMLRIHGKRKLRLRADGESVTLTPVPWLLDCMFRPTVAAKYPIFLLDDASAVEDIGMKSHDEGRDRYSYNEILPFQEQLAAKAASFQGVEDDELEAHQRMIRDLDSNVQYFGALVQFLDFARSSFGERGLPEFLSGIDTRLKGTSIVDALHTGDEEFRQLVFPLLEQFDAIVRKSQIIAFFPPSDKSKKIWNSPSDLIHDFLNKSGRYDPQATEKLGWLYEATKAYDSGDSHAFKEKIGILNEKVTGLAESRGEASTIGLELFYNKSDFFYYALVLFILAFILMTLTWLSPQSGTARIITKGTFWLTVVPLALVVVGITVRCIIMWRPPIGTLYETILFITGACVLVSLLVERVHKTGSILTLGTLIGAMGLFIAIRFEAIEGRDTMSPLPAVLRTNFWLSTHVVIINIGYAAGMLAAGVSHFYLLGKLFRINFGDRAYYRSITRMTYGVVCFCLLFSLVGTVLGGIWANDSWGRFWGWDPKENGALMIVLWALIILHLRMGGYIKELGLHISAVVLGCIVAFSWWGVNLLGIGLHNYGWISGVEPALYSFYGTQALVVLGGIIGYISERNFHRNQNTGSSGASKTGGSKASPDEPIPAS